MPLLDRNGRKADAWRRGDPDADAALVPLDLLAATLQARRPGQRVGVELPNTARPQALLPAQDQLELIAVAFPKFGDGRGFSLGRMLREQGYRGTFRVAGPIVPDQWPFALQCGFDEVELSDEQLARQPVEQWLHAPQVVSFTYQQAADGGPSIFQQRRAAR